MGYINLSLDKLSSDGNKKPANNPSLNYADNITHARLYYDDFAGSNYVQGVLSVNNNSVFMFDDSTIVFTNGLQLKTSTDGSSYSVNYDYSGDYGNSNIKGGLSLDPADGASYDLVCNNLAGDGIIFKSIQDIFDDAGVNFGGVDYKYVRGMLSQCTGINSGKAFFGNVYCNELTGVFDTNELSSPLITVANSFSLAQSSRISTGFYKLQFRYNSANGFGITATDYKFLDQTFEMWKKVEAIYDVGGSEQYTNFYTTEYVGKVVIDMASTSYGDLGMSDGAIYVKTYNAAGVLADDVLKAGLFLEIRAMPLA